MITLVNHSIDNYTAAYDSAYTLRMKTTHTTTQPFTISVASTESILDQQLTTFFDNAVLAARQTNLWSSTYSDDGAAGIRRISHSLDKIFNSGREL